MHQCINASMHQSKQNRIAFNAILKIHIKNFFFKNVMLNQNFELEEYLAKLISIYV